MNRQESYDPATGILTVHVPFALKRRGGRKLIIMPDGSPAPLQAARADNTLLKALARARRWSRLLDSGRHTSIKALAESEGINHSYVTRILRLTLLAPDIVEAILKGRQPKGLELAALMTEFPLEWDRQREAFGFPTTGEAGQKAKA
ncbi:MAG: hypothetical protein HQL34_04830 [Alphaproteobacteria bacterium]|nr:hypothetical protein [Alphaproteobacteria bacterium]